MPPDIEHHDGYGITTNDSNSVSDRVTLSREVSPDEVWSTLEAETRQEVVSEFRRIVKEMIDEHFRFDSAAASAATSRHLHPTVEPFAGADQHREPADAVRAA